MLTHPGTAVLPAALAAERTGCSGRLFLPRLQPAMRSTQFVHLVDACRWLDALDGAARTLISLTIPQ